MKDERDCCRLLSVLQDLLLSVSQVALLKLSQLKLTHYKVKFAPEKQIRSLSLNLGSQNTSRMCL